MPLDEFDLEAFLDRTTNFIREWMPSEQEPTYGVVWADSLDSIPVFVFGPDAGADALCALKEDGQIGFFPFAYTDDVVDLTCADRISYRLFLVDMNYQEFVDPEDSFGYLVQIEGGSILIRSAVRTFRDCAGCEPRIDLYRNFWFLEKAMEMFILSFKYEKETGTDQCGDCGCTEGQLHVLGCDQEHCPFCGGQLISCKCIYEMLDLQDEDPGTISLAPWLYEDGLTPEQEDRWFEMLSDKGRRPFIWWPLVCARCGQLSPFFFHVPDEDWEKYIDQRERNKIICRECYLDIKKLIDSGNRRSV